MDNAKLSNEAGISKGWKLVVDIGAWFLILCAIILLLIIFLMEDIEGAAISGIGFTAAICAYTGIRSLQRKKEGFFLTQIYHDSPLSAC
jgi:hypothetical protein